MERASPPDVPWLFFALAFGWSWTFWIVAAVSGMSVATSAGWMLVALGAFGPGLAGVACARFGDAGKGWADYWARLVEPRRVGLLWLGIIVVLAPGLMAVALGVEVAVDGDAALGLVEDRVRPLLAPWAIIPFLLAQIVMGPLLEEPGWRGYALDRLRRRSSALAASLILGGFWALWHLPLFVIPGTYHQTQGVGSTGFWLFLVGVILLSVVVTWIFDHTRRSTLGAILFHFVTNLAYVLGNVTVGTNAFMTLLWFVVAVAVSIRPARPRN